MGFEVEPWAVVHDEAATTDVASSGAPSVTRALEKPPRANARISADLPETFSYRVKRHLLGPPLTSENLSGQRVGKPTALAVLSSDVMSSSAYATEEILRILVPIGGLVAFSLVTPITGAILAVLAVVTICYREVIKAYPKAGGSYIVSRDNFGPNVAQVAGAALLISYTITVAVSVAAGSDAIISAFPVLNGAAVPMSIAFVILIAFANLRGIREAGRVFSVPTYLFIANMALLIISGLVREAMGSLPMASHTGANLPFGHSNDALLFGVGAFFLLKAFANGGSAMTGTEAISNGVSIFRSPQAKNARTTLVIMSSILGTMFLGISILAALTHASPFASGTPTVVSEIGKLVYGTGSAGRVLFFALQATTALILILAANTSFTGFPFLVSFVAEDSFLPRKLTVRGHRLVFSNGILVLAAASIALLLATEARVSALIPMYAIGVFTGFTMAGAGMVKHHLTYRAPRWRRSVVINAIAAVVCFMVVGVFAVTEFRSGAWVVVIAMPLLVFALIRTNRQYRDEESVLEEGAAVAACEATVLRRHVVIILLDRIDLAAARAIQYARALSPDDLRAVHFNIDERRTDLLTDRWKHLGLSRLPLDIIECPDRRIGRASLELAAELADGQTEVSLLLPRRSYRRAWGRILHDQTADKIVEIVSQLAHVNATIVPFQVAPGMEEAREIELSAELLNEPRRGNGNSSEPQGAEADLGVAGTTQISELVWRQPARIAGRIKSVRVQPLSGAPTLECSVVDSSGESLTVVFIGRQSIAGIRTGTKLIVDGRVGKHRNRLAIINPVYELISVPEGFNAADA